MKLQQEDDELQHDGGGVGDNSDIDKEVDRTANNNISDDL